MLSMDEMILFITLTSYYIHFEDITIATQTNACIFRRTHLYKYIYVYMKKKTTTNKKETREKSKCGNERKHVEKNMHEREISRLSIPRSSGIFRASHKVRGRQV